MASGGDLNQMSQSLFDQLKCVACEGLLKPGKTRWYRCLNHHWICQDCKSVGYKQLCFDPECREHLSRDHCPLTEELLKADSLLFKCTSPGCQEILKEKAMIEHEIECILKNVSCPRFLCEDKVPIHELLNHMKTKPCFKDLQGHQGFTPETIEFPLSKTKLNPHRRHRQ